MKKIITRKKRLMIFNFCLIFSFLAIVVANFTVQFKVEELQQNLSETHQKISFYREKMTILDAKFAFLTRPSRVKELAEKFLPGVSFAKLDQVKNEKQMVAFFEENYESELKTHVLAANY